MVFGRVCLCRLKRANGLIYPQLMADNTSVADLIPKRTHGVASYLDCHDISLYDGIRGGISNVVEPNLGATYAAGHEKNGNQQR
jgi:hypothetical protein